MQIFVPGFINCVRTGADSLRLNANRRGDFFITAQLQNIRNGTALGGATHFRNLVNLFHVSATRLGEEHQIVVRRRGEEMLDEIAFIFLRCAFARGHANDAFAASSLRPESADRGSFNKSAVGDADDAAFVCD